MTTTVFVQLRCKPGTTYKVADAISLREIHSELYSTSGEYDLLIKGGMIIDVKNELINAKVDVAVLEGKIAKVAENSGIDAVVIRGIKL